MSHNSAFTDIPQKQNSSRRGVFQLFSPIENSEHCLLRRLLLDNCDDNNHNFSFNEVAENNKNNTGNFLQRRVHLEATQTRPSVMQQLFEDPDNHLLMQDESQDNSQTNIYPQTSFRQQLQYPCFSQNNLFHDGQLNSSRNLFQSFQVSSVKENYQKKINIYQTKNTIVLKEQQKQQQQQQQYQQAQQQVSLHLQQEQQYQGQINSYQPQRNNEQSKLDSKFFSQFQARQQQQSRLNEQHLTRFKSIEGNVQTNQANNNTRNSATNNATTTSAAATYNKENSQDSSSLSSSSSSSSSSLQFQQQVTQTSTSASFNSFATSQQSSSSSLQSSQQHNNRINNQEMILLAAPPGLSKKNNLRAPPQSSKRTIYTPSSQQLGQAQITLNQVKQTESLVVTINNTNIQSQQPQQLSYSEVVLASPASYNSQTSSANKMILKQIQKNIYCEKKSNESSISSSAVSTSSSSSSSLGQSNQHKDATNTFTPLLPFATPIKATEDSRTLLGCSSSTSSMNSNKTTKNMQNPIGQTKTQFLEILGMAISKLHLFKPTIYWKLMPELAELAKRECLYHEAKWFYKIAISLQPFCPDVWLEYSKMEEDYGNLQKSKEILLNAYPFCKMSENLILKLLKIIDKIGNINEARQLLSNLSSWKLDKSWRIYIEGALIEIRFGYANNAELILRMLHQQLQSNGQVCYEYARILELNGKCNEAIQVCWEGLSDKGLKCVTLWNLFLKLYEKQSKILDVNVLSRFLRMANQSLSKEIIWKISLEIAQICEKKQQFNLAKSYIMNSVRTAHETMRWKPLIQAAKIELIQGNNQQAELIIQKALETCSDKQKPYLIIEAAKCTEITGKVTTALERLHELKPYMQTEWKVISSFDHLLNKLYSISQEINIICQLVYSFFNWIVLIDLHGICVNAGEKQSNRESKISHQGSIKHACSCREIMGELIQLEHISAKDNGGNLDKPFEYFLLALKEVPKSGEVWCEGVRLCMNPMGNKFDLAKAEQFLEYAIFFTPQYGDSFVEALRLYSILGDRLAIKQLKAKILISQPNYGHLWYYLKSNIRDTSIDVWKNMKAAIDRELKISFSAYSNRMQLLSPFELLSTQKFTFKSNNAVSHLKQSHQHNNNNNINNNDLMKQQQFIMTALEEYNNLFYSNTMTSTEIRWKIIFSLDQSLNQL